MRSLFGFQMTPVWDLIITHLMTSVSAFMHTDNLICCKQSVSGNQNWWVNSKSLERVVTTQSVFVHNKRIALHFTQPVLLSHVDSTNCTQLGQRRRPLGLEILVSTLRNKLLSNFWSCYSTLVFFIKMCSFHISGDNFLHN